MAIPPEVLFHRYFQEVAPPHIAVRPEDPDPRPYKGKLDLDAVPDPRFRAWLQRLQAGWTEALRNEKQGVAGHADHPAFHVDYLDSSLPNALAFRYQDYSFIGITIALLNTLWDVSVRLSRSEAVASAVGVSLPDEDNGALQIVFFQILSSFVMAHEYTHHVHGHEGSVYSNEIVDDGNTGSLEHQIIEADADGYATYLVLANLLDGAARAAVTILKLDALPVGTHDEVLFSCFVAATGAYLFIRPAPPLDNVTIYRLTHPPQAARMNLLMHHAMNWCEQNRPALQGFMTLERFQSLMNTVAETLLGAGGRSIWAMQTAFLQTENGAEYFRQIDQGLKALVSALHK